MPVQITPFTTTPSRANPATFSADMDTRLTQENSRIVEMNNQSTENNNINTNVNAKEVLATAAAATATTKATLATDYAEKMALEVEAGTYSSKEHAIGDLTTTGGSAKAWAIDTASPDGTTTKSAKTLATEAATSASNASLSEIAAAASAASAAAIAGAFVGTSTTSVLIATGSKSFTTQTGEQYTSGIFLTAVSQANPLNYMFGQVTSYDSGTGALVLDVQVISGSGTYADWNLSLVGARGAQGEQGIPGATFTGGNLTSALNEARATVVSHATTADIWGALGNQIDFTGTATVTAFPNAPQAGATRELICAGACSFTAGANMLIDGVTSGNTVTCAANDTVIVRAISTTQFKLTRLKADGTAQVSPAGGAMIYLSTITATGASTVDIETGFSATYDDYIIVADRMFGSVGAFVELRLKIGGVYLTTNYYGNLTNLSSGSTSYSGIATSNLTSATVLQVGSGANDNSGMTINIYDTNSARVNVLSFSGTLQLPTANIAHIGTISNSNGGVLSGVRLFLASGTITGIFKLYGIAKA